MAKLHIFDMDGTLLKGSACLEVSRQLGQIDAINVIEQAWGRGEVGHVEFYELCLPLWEGMTDADVEATFQATPWLNGIQEVWADIADRGEFSAVISLSPQFFLDHLRAWGVGSSHGAVVHPSRELDAQQVLTPASKVLIAKQLMAEHAVAADDVVAYGDSASDIPLFEHFTTTVAVNGSEAIRAAAAGHYEGDDLRGAYAVARALLDSPTRNNDRVGAQA